MTLIVVDQHRTTADSYATQHEGDKTTVHNDFPKILRMKAPLHYRPGGYTSFHTVAYCGSANTFVAFWKRIDEQQSEGVVLSELDLLQAAQELNGEPCQVIFPFSNAVLVLMVGNGHAEVEWREGSVHAFGGSYVEPAHGQEEYRTWYSIFYDAWDAGKLPGQDIHFMSHVGEGKAISDTMKPESTVKRIRRRMPWRQRVSKKAKHS